MAASATFQSKLDHLPDQPGVYLFLNEAGETLYVDGAESTTGYPDLGAIAAGAT